MKTKDLTLPELKAGELPKPEEKVKVDWDKWAEQEALLETEPEDSPLSGEHSFELTETAPELSRENAFHIPAHYKDLGDLTQEEWQEVFGKPGAMKKYVRKNQC